MDGWIDRWVDRWMDISLMDNYVYTFIHPFIHPSIGSILCRGGEGRKPLRRTAGTDQAIQCWYVCLYVWMDGSICPFVQLIPSFIHPFIHSFIRPFLSIHLTIYLFIYPSIHPSIHSGGEEQRNDGIHLSSSYLSIYLSIYPSIHPSIHPQTCLAKFNEKQQPIKDTRADADISPFCTRQPPIHLCILPSIYPSIHLPIHLSIHRQIERQIDRWMGMTDLYGEIQRETVANKGHQSGR